MSTQTDKPEPLILRLENVRLSFPNLFEPKEPKGGGKPKFSADFLLDKKKHKDLITKIEKVCDRAMLNKWGKKVGISQMCFKDGNDPKKQDIEGYGDEVMYLTAKAEPKNRPSVVNQKKAPVTEKDNLIYGGCYVNAMVEIYGFKHPVGGNCILASLHAVQFVCNGDSLGGGVRVDAQKAFDEVEGGEPSESAEDY